MFINSKICTGCEKTLSYECFGKLASHPTGLQYRCKKCRALYFQTIEKPKATYKTEERRAKRREYRKRDSVRLSNRVYNHSEERKAYMRDYMRKWSQQPDKKRKQRLRTILRQDEINRQQRMRRQSNLTETRAELALRRKRVAQATPTWVNKGQLKRIYKACPVNCVVDHVIPIKSDKICGLNVPWNLQYLSNEQNLIKHNKFDGTYANVSWMTDAAVSQRP